MDQEPTPMSATTTKKTPSTAPSAAEVRERLITQVDDAPAVRAALSKAIPITTHLLERQAADAHYRQLSDPNLRMHVERPVSRDEMIAAAQQAPHGERAGRRRTSGHRGRAGGRRGTAVRAHSTRGVVRRLHALAIACRIRGGATGRRSAARGRGNRIPPTRKRRKSRLLQSDQSADVVGAVGACARRGPALRLSRRGVLAGSQHRCGWVPVVSKNPARRPQPQCSLWWSGAQGPVCEERTR